MRRLGEHHSQREIAGWLGITQPSVQKTLKVVAKDLAPLEGFSGGSPYEICQRSAAGFMQREHVVDELTRFPDTKGDNTDGNDSLTVDTTDTWAYISTALRRELIADDVYEGVFQRWRGL